MTSLVPMTLSDLQGHSPSVRLFKCDFHTAIQQLTGFQLAVHCAMTLQQLSFLFTLHNFIAFDQPYKELLMKAQIIKKLYLLHHWVESTETTMVLIIVCISHVCIFLCLKLRVSFLVQQGNVAEALRLTEEYLMLGNCEWCLLSVAYLLQLCCVLSSLVPACCCYITAHILIKRHMKAC